MREKKKKSIPTELSMQYCFVNWMLNTLQCFEFELKNSRFLLQPWESIIKNIAMCWWCWCKRSLNKPLNINKHLLLPIATFKNSSIATNTRGSQCLPAQKIFLYIVFLIIFTIITACTTQNSHQNFQNQIYPKLQGIAHCLDQDLCRYLCSLQSRQRS